MTSPPTRSQAPPSMTMGKKVGLGLLFLLVGVTPSIVPAILLFDGIAFTIVLYGVMVAVLNTALGNPRDALILTGIYILLIPVALATGTTPLAGACVIALVCLATGVASYWKRYMTLYLIPLGVAFTLTLLPDQIHTLTGSPTATRRLLLVLALTAGGAVWASFVTRRLVGSKSIPLTITNPPREVLVYTLVMATLVSISTWWVLGHARADNGIWLMLTLLIVIQVGGHGETHKLVHRIMGTIPGAIVAVLVSGLGEPQWFIWVMFTLALIGMIAFLNVEPYALFVFFLTNVVLLGMSQGGHTLSTSLERVGFTLLGAALAFIALAIETLVLRSPSSPAAVTSQQQ